MDLYLLSASENTDLTRPVLDQIASAIEHQLFAHVAPFWQSAGVRVSALTSHSSLPDTSGATPIIVYDDADQADALGWHTYAAGKGSFGSVFLKLILDQGGTFTEGANSLSAVLSHECIEAAVDPYVNLLAQGRDAEGEFLEPLEACDRVQGDSYVIGGTAVSNFLGPRAFRDGEGPFDWMRRITSPWEIRPGGYVERIRDGKSVYAWGEALPAWKKDLVLHRRERKISRLAQRQQRIPTRNVPG